MPAEGHLFAVFLGLDLAQAEVGGDLRMQHAASQVGERSIIDEIKQRPHRVMDTVVTVTASKGVGGLDQGLVLRGAAQRVQ